MAVLYTTTMYLLLVVTIMYADPVVASIHSIINHYEEIHSRDISVRIKRDLKTERVSWKHLSFRALGISFEFKLVPDHAILSTDFSALTINRNGRSDRLNIDLDEIYSGYDTNKPENKVDAFKSNEVWQMQIRTPTDEFVVEPFRRFDPTHIGDISIIYNAKDVNTHNTTASHSESTSFCRASRHFFPRSRSATKFNINNEPALRQRREHEFIDLKSLTEPAASLEKQNVMFDHLTNTSRTKRQTAQDTCDVLMVVDWRMFQGIGEGSADVIAKWITHSLKLVDR